MRKLGRSFMFEWGNIAPQNIFSTKYFYQIILLSASDAYIDFFN